MVLVVGSSTHQLQLPGVGLLDFQYLQLAEPRNSNCKPAVKAL